MINNKSLLLRLVGLLLTYLSKMQGHSNIKFIITMLLLSLVTGLSFIVLLLNQRRSPPPRVQVSDCNTSRIMCDVQSTANFCSESTECFPGMASKYSSKPFVTTATPTTINTNTRSHLIFRWWHCKLSNSCL